MRVNRYDSLLLVAAGIGIYLVARGLVSAGWFDWLLVAQPAESPSDEP